MRLQSKIAVLSCVLVADLLFFLLFMEFYPEALKQVYLWLPWDDSLEKAVAIIAGFAVATTSSIVIISLFLKELQRLVG